MIKEKNPFEKLHVNILKNKMSLIDHKKIVNQDCGNSSKIHISTIDLENKWHEQDGRCHWTGMEMNLSLLFDDQENNSLTHPLTPSIDKINPEGEYEYDNIFICIRMMSLARENYSFDKFYQIMTKITESLISNKTSPEYIKKYFIQKQQNENMQKQIESSQKPEITWDDIFFINPKLKNISS